MIFHAVVGFIMLGFFYLQKMFVEEAELPNFHS